MTKTAANDPPAALVRVTYSPEWKSWGVHKYDTEGDQIGGEGEWYAFKREAVARARELAGYNCRLEIYTICGDVRREFGKRKGYR